VATPDLVVSTLDGERVPLSRILGPERTVVLFWEVESRTSREALIHLGGLGSTLSERKASVIAVTRGGRRPVAAFYAVQNPGVPCFIDFSGYVSDRLGVGNVLPLTVVLAPDGAELGRVEGGGGILEPRLLAVLGAEGGGFGGWKLGLALGGLAAIMAVVLAR